MGGSAEEVARVVAACRECDTTGAWSHQPKGTPVCQWLNKSNFYQAFQPSNFLNCIQASWQPGDSLTSDISQSKMSAKAEKATVEKKKKEEEVVNAMDKVQPFDSISNVSPN